MPRRTRIALIAIGSIAGLGAAFFTGGTAAYFMGFFTALVWALEVSESMKEDEK